MEEKLKVIGDQNTMLINVREACSKTRSRAKSLLMSFNLHASIKEDIDELLEICDRVEEDAVDVFIAEIQKIYIDPFKDHDLVL
jgi:hypothetical protein